MRIILKRDPQKNIPKYSIIKNLLETASTNELSNVDSIDFNEIRAILGDHKIPSGHIQQVAQDLGLEVKP